MNWAADARPACPLCRPRAEAVAARRGPPGEPGDGGELALASSVANLVPFLVQAVMSFTATPDRAVWQAHGADWVALASGAVGVVCGVLAIGAAGARASGGWLALGVLLALLGAYHVARGAAIVG